MLKLALCSLLVGSPALAQHGAGNAIVMFADPDPGTWTGFTVTPDGNACRVADGVAFEYHKPKPNA